jgi:23S rRNA (cytidine1920-2'-O)/16S rRNA (cytidine1409-2'-O)-methyltransferase
MRRRLDVAVVERGLAETRARAQALIGGGRVTVNGEVVTRSGAQVSAEDKLALAHEALPFVSRGALKLAHALREFVAPVSGVVALDVGASTGGFTDALLQGGARRVYAVDVGYGQLAWKLRNDPRVVVMERTNVRSLESLPEAIDLAVADVSFISLRLVLPVMARLLRPQGEAIVLIKPQFEAGRRQVGKKGVVRDPAVWREVLAGVLRYAEQGGWRVLGLARSPIRGPAGNVEFLAHLSRDPAALSMALDPAIGRVIGTT